MLIIQMHFAVLIKFMWLFYSGYMSPEYAMDGIFSVKSDVFSYGVLLLEIVSGRRNRGAYSYSNNQSLLGHVSDNLPHLVNTSCICQ